MTQTIHAQSSMQEAIDRYLGSGEYDAMHFAWPGDNFMDCGRIGTAALREALIATIRQRSTHAVAPPALAALDMATFGRARASAHGQGIVCAERAGNRARRFGRLDRLPDSGKY